jgi:type IV secretory pathway VirB10-like protein
MIELLKEPNGERLSTVRIVILCVIVFFLVMIPLAFWVSIAKKGHEQRLDDQKQATSTSDQPVTSDNSVSTQMKRKSSEAVGSISGNKGTSQHSNPMLGGDPLARQQVPGLNNPMDKAVGQNYSGTQEQRPPMSGSNQGVVTNNSDPVTQEITNQKVDRTKRVYEAKNTPITLGGGVYGPDKSTPEQNTTTSSNKNQNSIADGSVVDSSNPNVSNTLMNGSSPSGPTSNSSTSDDDQNKQNEKIAFLKNATGGDEADMVNPGAVLPQPSECSLFAGDFIPSIMISGLNSDMPGQITAQVAENIYDTKTGKCLVMPKGSRLVGVYDSKVAYLQKRVLVAWKRVTFPDGKRYMLRGMPGTDQAGYAGFYNPEGVDNHYWQLYSSSAMIGVITGTMQLSQNNTNANVQSGGIGMTTNNNPSVGQTMAGSLGQQMGQTGLSVMSKNVNVQPTLTIPPGYEFNIQITADLQLIPYSKKYK